MEELPSEKGEAMSGNTEDSLRTVTVRSQEEIYRLRDHNAALVEALKELLDANKDFVYSLHHECGALFTRNAFDRRAAAEDKARAVLKPVEGK